MNEIDHLALLAELESAHCELNHGPDTENKNIPAIDYIIQPFGRTINEVEEVAVRELVIPICAECSKAFQGNKWTLLYCFECMESQWVYRDHAKNRYRHNILWLRGCPSCTNKFGGLYFTDLQTCGALFFKEELRKVG